ncbi:MAG: aminoglycoside phosphotransferase family protein [Actinomycetota bacterium]|nr:aminoglycoside phosphotransferase family protein [Actinomycetota bacterium]
MSANPPTAEIEAARAATGFSLEMEAPLRGRFGWRAASQEAVAYLAAEEEGRRRLLREARVYSWARDQGIPVPRTIAVAPDGSYLVMQRVSSDPAQGVSYVERSIDAADRIAAATWPRSEVVQGARKRSPRLRSIPLRWSRLALGPLDLSEVVGVYRRVGRLPSQALAHGDFDARNVLFDATAATVKVVDWEFLGPAPLHTDLAMLWTTLERYDDRRLLEDLVVDRLDPSAQADLALLMRWTSLRLLVEVLTWSPARGRNVPRIERAFAVLEEARERDRSRKIGSHG